MPSLTHTLPIMNVTQKNSITNPATKKDGLVVFSSFAEIIRCQTSSWILLQGGDLWPNLGIERRNSL